MTNFIKTSLRLLIVLIIIIGLLTVIGGVGLGLLASYRLNLIQAWLPKEQVRVLETASVQLNGPRFSIKGDRVYFHAASTGAGNRVSWSLHPYKAGALNVSPTDRHSAEFSSLDEGHYTITVSVAGEGEQPPAIGQLQFENVALASEDDLHPEPVAQQPVAPVHAMNQSAADMPPEPPPASTAELTRGALSMVTSANKMAEARQVADVIYSLAKQARGGLLPPRYDIPLEIERRSNKALQGRMADWGTFMVSIDTILGEKIKQRVITGEVATQWPVLMEIADTLTSAR